MTWARCHRAARNAGRIGGWEPLGRRRHGVAHGTAAPNKDQIASQAQRLRRIFKSGDVTIKSLDLIAAALGQPLNELLALLFDQPTVSVATAPHKTDLAKSHPESEKRQEFFPVAPTGD